MRHLAKHARTFFQSLIVQVDAQDEPHLKIDNNDTFMALVVERISNSPRLYSFAHYFEQNRDLIPDPEVILYATDDHLYPVSIQHSFGPVRTALTFDGAHPDKYSPSEQRALVSFCTDWARNLKSQQGL